MPPGPVLTVLGIHVLVAALAGPLFRVLRHRAFLVLAMAPGSLFLWCIARVLGVGEAGSPHVESFGWAPSLHFDLTVRVDGLSLLMSAIVSGIGVLVLVYSAGYFRGGQRPATTATGSTSTDPVREVEDGLRRKARIGRLLVLFAGAMAGLVVSDDLFAVFMFWEFTSVISYLLIGTEDHSASARAAALRAYVTTAMGGLAILAGFVLLGSTSGTWTVSGIVETPPGGTVTAVAVGLVLVGALTKSAQFPFHFWLAPAMAAPTPVSAYLHSATMVKAGVYLIARLAIPFGDIGYWRPVVIALGSATMLLGAWRALSQRDLKVLLAHGTVSQLGFMVILFGIGHELTTTAGIVLLISHALFKATLFMVVGTIDLGAGTRNVDELSNLWPRMRITTIVTVVAAASMAGVPLVMGFIAKESALDALRGVGGASGATALAVIVVGSILTAAYSARIVGAVFGRLGPASSERPDRTDGSSTPSTSGSLIGEGPITMVGPAMVLTALTILFGLVPGLLSEPVVTVAGSLGADMVGHGLSIWHGFNLTLVLSIVILAAGGSLWSLRAPVSRAQGRVGTTFSAARSFDRGAAGLLRFADRFTGHLQTGSLPFYLIVILVTSLLLPGVAFIRGDLPNPIAGGFGDWRQILAVAVIVLASIGSMTIRHRLGAVLCVGTAGYGVALMFMLSGAPDLALTQLLVETLGLVVFVLVLRHLPQRFAPDQTAFAVLPRVLLSLSVGVAAAMFTLFAYAGRPSWVTPVSEEYLANSRAAGGNNVVNVILVEFRAFDTFGEISVLTVAALGVLGLVRAVKRQRGGDHEPNAPLRPSFVLDAAVRSLFHALLLVSVVLLLGGHDEPGGGFVGGLVAGSAFLLVHLSGGEAGLRRREPLAAEVFLGLGLVAAFLAGSIGWFGGGAFLESRTWELDPPLLGHLKVSTQLLFETGVYLVVIGVVMAILRSLGREEVYGTT